MDWDHQLIVPLSIPYVLMYKLKFQFVFMCKISWVDLYMGNVFHASLHNGLWGLKM